jgi:hypothetical protein
MRFPIRIPVTHAVTGANPVTNPGDVDPNLVVRLPFKPYPNGEQFVNRIIITLAATAAETVTVDLWAVDEDTMPKPDQNIVPAVLAARRFYLIASGIILTAPALQERTQLIAPGAVLYVRPTADTMVSTGTVLISCAA